MGMAPHGDDSKDDSSPAVRFFLWRIVRLGKRLVQVGRGAGPFEGSRVFRNFVNVFWGSGFGFAVVGAYRFGFGFVSFT